MPPLPVSSTKLSVSLNSSSIACRTIMPPLSCINDMVVTNFAGGCTNSSCANNLQPKRSIINMLQAFVILFCTVSILVVELYEIELTAVYIPVLTGNFQQGEKAIV